ncbi:hypothetical protein [Streptomyces guryensis]|nr:hypothetical protein [Streptomyces guryensis]
MHRRNGVRVELVLKAPIDAYSYTKLGNPDTYQLVATWKDKA